MNTAEYLIKKLEELGINHFFGLPGDFNFEILYAIENNPNTNWIGCTNELNAGYAADGYARERGYGALVTTYGVGELSALNAIAGSYAENIPVINIVGVPSSKCINNKTRVHHNFMDVDPFRYEETFKNVVETTAFLNRDNAKIEIDRVLKTFVKERRPVYIAIPVDIAKYEISEREVDYNFHSDPETLKKVANLIIQKIKRSKKPTILGDSLIKRFDSELEYKHFVEKSGIPTTNFLMGTNILDNDLENNLGTYFSKFKNPTAQKQLEETDCLIAVGAIYSDFNSFGFNLPYKINSQVAIYGTHTYIEGVKFENIKMADILEAVTELIEYQNYPIEKFPVEYPKTNKPENKLTSKYIYARIQEYLRENDIFIAETGIVQHGTAQIKFPNNVEYESQTLYSSIGWATPATLGMNLASPNKRVVLFTGDGAHQISAMEIGTMLRYGIKPIIIVLNNQGYTIERVLSDKYDNEINNIVNMNYAKFARVFEGDIWATKVETEDDFDKALKVSQIMNRLCYIEICTEKDDLPDLTKEIIKEYKTKLKEENTSIPETYCSKKSETKLSKMISNFGTKVHESLKSQE